MMAPHQRERDFFAQRAQDMGWKNPPFTQERSIEEIHELYWTQVKLYFRICSFFEHGLPAWVDEDVVFPIEPDWLETVEARLEFDMNWRIRWSKELLHIHPKYHKELPSLPAHIVASDIPSLVALLGEIRSRFWNKMYAMFSYFDVGFRFARNL